MELDGQWTVRRTGGLLPPLAGVRKRIAGDVGTTTLGPLRAGFDVVGDELRYRGPLAFVVDVVAPDGPDALRGEMRLFGRPAARFAMRRLDGAQSRPV